MVAEFRHALELILTQKCVVSSIIRREITEIVLHGDVDLEETITAQRVDVDPAIQTVFMSGLVHAYDPMPDTQPRSRKRPLEKEEDE